MALLMNFMINTLGSCKRETICLINSCLNYYNNSIYTFVFRHSIWAVSSVGRAIPFKEWVDGSSPSRLTINVYKILIGGYFKMTR